mmetsp:Transcript_18214/g.27783  ORF Transcript_18214/g.27783 Transcript_18214/m.27783 type:complete len:97 (-) Transcript_18214:180-470(-)
MNSNGYNLRKVQVRKTIPFVTLYSQPNSSLVPMWVEVSQMKVSFEFLSLTWRWMLQLHLQQMMAQMTSEVYVDGVGAVVLVGVGVVDYVRFFQGET